MNRISEDVTVEKLQQQRESELQNISGAKRPPF